MNGEVCCILGICCPPEARGAALATEMVKDNVFDGRFNARAPEDVQAYAQHVAEYIFKHFDLVPAGTGVPLMKAAAAHAQRKP